MPYATAADGVALLREVRQRHAGDLRARIRRRLPQLGAADALLRAPLPLHRLQRARLSAVGRAGRWRSYSQARARDDIVAVLDAARASKARTSSGCRWAASRRCMSASVSRARAFAGGGGLRLRRRAGKREQVPRRSARPSRRASRRGHAGGGRAATRWARRACSSRTRTRAAGPSSPADGASIRRAARRTRCAACRSERPSLWDLVERHATLTVPTLIVTGDEDDPCLEPGAVHEAHHPDRGHLDVPAQRPHPQSRGARRVQPPRSATSSPPSTTAAGIRATARSVAGGIIGFDKQERP